MGHFCEEIHHLESNRALNGPNEIRLITKLYNGSNRNKITVLGHRTFADSIYACVDMDLCDFSLDEYNKCQRLVEQVEGNPRG